MPDHIHGCLNCRPDMVPDFSRDDPRYHDGEKCGVRLRILVNGAEPGYTMGVYEGDEGWVLLASHGFDTGQIHVCPNCTTYTEYEGYPLIDHHEICVEPRFGRVEVIHECPAVSKSREDRLEVLRRAV